MLNLVSAIQSTFASNPAFSVFLNGLENSMGKDKETLPNCLLVEVSSVSEYGTKNEFGKTPYIDTCHVQFTIRASSGTQVAQAVNNLRSTYDHKPLTLGNGEFLMDGRYVGGGTVRKEDERVYRADAEYKFVVGGSL